MTPAKKHEADSRADADIAKDVFRRMKEDMDVPDDRIQTKVERGVVTLFGTVGHDEQKRAAEACVGGIDGVREIRNLIEVDPAAAVTEA